METISKTKFCTISGEEFPIFEADQRVYQSFDVPEPTLSYYWRMLRRLSFRNERHLYHRTCDLTGRKMLSSFSEDKPYPIYDNETWWGDCWDPLVYGRDIDFSRPFLEQFYELSELVPRLARQQQEPMENSEYCNCASYDKNCYLMFSTNFSEECYYGSWANNCQYCVDSYNIVECELCYDCSACRECYNLQYSDDCSNCRDSYFLKDCVGCSDCFGSHSLSQAQYVVFNEQKTKDEYEAFLASVELGSRAEVSRLSEEIASFRKGMIVRAFHGIRTENVTGDYLRNSKDLHYCFQIDNGEDLRYCMALNEAKSSMDYSYWGRGGERLYECQACGYSIFNLRFCNLCWSGCSNLTYCDQCISVNDCFGCVGLKKARFCILNKQYSEDDYAALEKKLVAHMKETGEWGEFFSPSHSIYAYNETLSNEEYPMTKEEVSALGWRWRDEPPTEAPSSVPEVPDNISDVSDSICSEVLYCENTGKHYKIIPQELAFCREHNIPIPRLAPDERHRIRFGKRNPRLLWPRTCELTGIDMLTSYAPNRDERVYSEEAYQEAIFT